ncbi:MAG: dimethylsulfonioproprionate lyase DddP [Gammaproteobacteria bacterium]
MATSPFSIDSTRRKIDPSRRPSSALKPDGTPDDNDRIETGPTAIAFGEWQALGLEIPHLDTMREYRLQRLCGEIRRHDYGGILLFDPLNIRYATDAINMQLWTSHNPARACFVSADGYIVLWDFHNCEHLSTHLPLIKERRTGAGFFYFLSADRSEEHARRFAQDVDDVVREHTGRNRRLAVDKIEISGLRALEQLGLEIFDGQEVTEIARVVKGPDEIKALYCATAACEASMVKMQEAIYAGQSESDIWAVLHAENIRRGGEWIETRICSSGPRTNPWFQEAGPRIISDGELLALDTDLIGPYGMCCDISRTWLCGDVEPSADQKRLYQVAYEHIMGNRELLKPGVSFRELTEKGLRLPEEYRQQSYSVMMHGAGLCDEYPAIYYPEQLASSGYDGIVEAGMVFCVEAYIGAVGGINGVKLEEQVVVTETGFEQMSKYPFEAKLLS